MRKMLSIILMANPSWVASRTLTRCLFDFFFISTPFAALWWNSQKSRALVVTCTKTEGMQFSEQTVTHPFLPLLDLLAADLEPVGLPEFV